MDHVWIDRRWHSTVLDAWSFRAAILTTIHLVVAKIIDRPAVSKKKSHRVK
jgi:hypothetical protein